MDMRNDNGACCRERRRREEFAEELKTLIKKKNYTIREEDEVLSLLRDKMEED